MAPRFVEIATPVDEGARLLSIVHAHLSSAAIKLRAVEWPAPFYNALALFPLPTGFARHLLLAAFATAVSRLLYVRWRTRCIMGTHGCFRDKKNA